MKKNVKMFKGMSLGEKLEQNKIEKAKGLSYEDCMKLYQVISYKEYLNGEKMCEYGSFGNQFYIILDGEVSVRQPKEVELQFNLVWDLYQYIVKEYENIRTFRDEESKAIGNVVDIIGAPLLR